MTSPQAASAASASRPPRTLLGLAAVASAIALIPLGYLLFRASQAGLGAIVDVLARPRAVQTALTSIALTAVVVVATLVLGMPIAWLLARTRLPGGRVWLVLVALPLAIPSYVAAYAWLAQFPAMSGLWAAALVLTAVSLPYVVLPCVAAFRLADPAPEEVARTLGRTPWQAFRGATLPQVWPAAAAGALLVALYTLSDFGAVALFRVDAFTRVIYASYRASFDRTSAAVLSLVLVALALVLVLLERRVRGRGLRYRAATGTARRAIPLDLSPKWKSGALALLAVTTFIALVIPIGSLLLRLAEGARRPLDLGELVNAALATAGVALMGAVVALALALPVAALAARYRQRSVRTIETAAYASHALPGVVVGLALVFFTLSVIPVAYQTLATLAFAYAVLFWPKAIGSSRTAIASVSPVLPDVARTLGRRPIAAWLATTARIASPGIAAGGLLVLLTAMKELPATLMLRPTGLDTLATELWSRTEVAAYGAAAPYALALIALAAIPAWLLSTRTGGLAGSAE